MRLTTPIFLKTKMTLDEILEPIKPELIQFETHLDSIILVSKIKLAIDVITHINSNNAKRLRPSIMFLVANAIGKINQHTYDNAAMVEILHTATLIHDDVVDNSEQRRGKPSVNFKWDNRIAVLVGDFLYACGMRIALEQNDFNFLRIMFYAVETMSEAELWAIQLSDSIQSGNILNFNEENYLDITFSKTASLISTACKISAMTITNDETIINTFAEYGKNVGIAFQMRDDIFDYMSNSNHIGKPVGNDIREKKITLPLIFALNNSSKNEQTEILKLIQKRNITDIEIKQVIDFAITKGGIEYATNKANEYSQNAINCLNFLSDSMAKTALLDFAKFVVLRDK
jgi:octaprenyl-diphosphate synthase